MTVKKWKKRRLKRPRTKVSNRYDEVVHATPKPKSLSINIRRDGPCHPEASQQNRCQFTPASCRGLPLRLVVVLLASARVRFGVVLLLRLCRLNPSPVEETREWQPISTYRRPNDNLHRSEFDTVIKRLKRSKATGPDDVPDEVYKYCPDIKNELSSKSWSSSGTVNVSLRTWSAADLSCSGNVRDRPTTQVPIHSLKTGKQASVLDGDAETIPWF